MSDKVYTGDNNFPLLAVFWEDHINRMCSPIPDNPDDEIIPTLTVGILVRETEKLLVLVSTFERYEDRDDADYMIILKSTIVGRKEYGKIELDHIRYT